jgi:hypothetical protein
MLLREGEQARSRGKCRPAGGIRESGETQWSAGPHLLVENRARDFGYAVELAAATDQNRASAGQLILC